MPLGSFFLLVVALEPWLEMTENSGEPDEMGETARLVCADRLVGG